MYQFPRTPSARQIAGGGWIVPPEPPPTASRSLLAGVRPAPRLRAALADPDPGSRERLRRLLEEVPGIRVVGESDSARGVVQLIQRTAPDVLFLDVLLPDMDGIQLARTLDGKLVAGLIFVTEQHDRALQAFEVHALDYLLKPVQRDRLEWALGQARAVLRGRRDSGSQDRLIALLDKRDAERQRRARLLIRRPEGAFFLKTELIDWVEAAGKLTRVHASKRVYEQREALVRIEQHLDRARFVRISRSAIVNLERIREIQSWFNGEYLVILDDGSQVPSSRRYRGNLRRLLGKDGEG
jgi:two-component system, LytTR family, response regulator